MNDVVITGVVPIKDSLSKACELLTKYSASLDSVGFQLQVIYPMSKGEPAIRAGDSCLEVRLPSAIKNIRSLGAKGLCLFQVADHRAAASTVDFVNRVEESLSPALVWLGPGQSYFYSSEIDENQFKRQDSALSCLVVGSWDLSEAEHFVGGSLIPKGITYCCNPIDGIDEVERKLRLLGHFRWKLFWHPSTMSSYNGNAGNHLRTCFEILRDEGILQEITMVGSVEQVIEMCEIANEISES